MINFNFILFILICFACNQSNLKFNAEKMKVSSSGNETRFYQHRESESYHTFTKQFCKNYEPLIDSIVTFYNEKNYLTTYIYDCYDSLENVPIRSLKVIDNMGRIIYYNQGQSLFLEDFGPDENHVTIYPLFNIINFDTLQITLSFFFYPELSSAYTDEITSRLDIQRPYGKSNCLFIKYTFNLNGSYFGCSKEYLIYPQHYVKRGIEEIYSDFQTIKSNNFLPIYDKDELYRDLYFLNIRGDTNNTYEMISSYIHKWDSGDIHYQLTRYLLSF